MTIFCLQCVKTKRFRHHHARFRNAMMALLTEERMRLEQKFVLCTVGSANHYLVLPKRLLRSAPTPMCKAIAEPQGPGLGLLFEHLDSCFRPAGHPGALRCAVALRGDDLLAERQLAACFRAGCLPVCAGEGSALRCLIIIRYKTHITVYMLSCSVLTSPPWYGPPRPWARHNVPPLGYLRLLTFHTCLYSLT